MITIEGRYDGKVIVPDEPLDLPAGTALRITAEVVVAGKEQPLDVWQRILKISERMPGDLPSDYAERHDDYARQRLGLQ